MENDNGEGEDDGDHGENDDNTIVGVDQNKKKHQRKLTLIVDSYSLFVRSYAAYPSVSSITGEQTGGVVGYLKTLGRLVDELRPFRVIVVWEGGGSTRRRGIYKDYKRGSKPQRLNRFYDSGDIPDTESNKMQQVAVLLGAVKKLPITQLYVSDCEADDVIAYLCKSHLADDEKVIVTSDRDMYQLLSNPLVRVYNLHKKVYVTSKDVLEEFRVTANNFALAKTLCGDASDNIPGIKGLGYKTTAKYFPILGTDADVLLQDVISMASARYGENQVFNRVVEGADDLKRNWKLVYLGSSCLSHDQGKKLRDQLERGNSAPDLHGFAQFLVQHGINGIDVQWLFNTMRCIG